MTKLTFVQTLDYMLSPRCEKQSGLDTNIMLSGVSLGLDTDLGLDTEIKGGFESGLVRMIVMTSAIAGANIVFGMGFRSPPRYLTSIAKGPLHLTDTFKRWFWIGALGSIPVHVLRTGLTNKASPGERREIRSWRECSGEEKRKFFISFAGQTLCASACVVASQFAMGFPLLAVLMRFGAQRFWSGLGGFTCGAMVSFPIAFTVAAGLRGAVYPPKVRSY